jgi:hypothetical protein
VAPGAGEEAFLGVGGEGGQGVGERGTEASLLEPPLGGGSETVGEGEAAGHPGLAAPEEAGDRGDREPVVADEGIDDARLVQGVDGARRGVRAQQEGLALGQGAGPFEDGGDLLQAYGRPAGQALEPIDDLEGAVVLRDDPQREVCERLRRRVARRARAQGREARAQTVDREAAEPGTVGESLGKLPRPARGRPERLRLAQGGRDGCPHRGRYPSTRTQGLPS